MGLGDAIVSAVKDTLGLGGDDSTIPGWQQRLKEAAYTSPGGTRIVFQYVDLKRSTKKRTARFQFNGINGAYIQDNGNDEGVYPIVALFTGDDNDRLGTAFEVACLETGRGKLEHPMYGTFDVVPTGTIERSNAMVEEANQTRVMVTFSSTLAEVYPDFSGIPKSQIGQTIAGWDVASAAEFAGNVDLNDPIGQALMGNSVVKGIDKAAQTVRAASNGIAGAQRAFDNQARQLTESLDTLLNAPQDLATQMINLIKSPAGFAEDIGAMLAGYFSFSASLSAGFGDTDNPNDVALNNLMMSCATNATVLSANEIPFKNRADALDTAQNIITLNNANNAALDDLFREQSFLDPGAGFQLNQRAVSQITGRLISDSFGLLPERVIYLQRDRSIVDLCGELYGSVDDSVLQNLIDTNRIGGEELYVVPRGRRIVYYA
jgi:prophage DNA circulation protein